MVGDLGRPVGKGEAGIFGAAAAGWLAHEAALPIRALSGVSKDSALPTGALAGWSVSGGETGLCMAGDAGWLCNGSAKSASALEDWLLDVSVLLTGAASGWPVGDGVADVLVGAGDVGWLPGGGSTG